MAHHDTSPEVLTSRHACWGPREVGADQMNRLRHLARPEEPDCGVAERMLDALTDADAVLDELRQVGLPDEAPFDTLMHLLDDADDYIRIADRLRPFARPDEMPAETFDQLMDGLTGFLQGLVSH